MLRNKGFDSESGLDQNRSWPSTKGRCWFYPTATWALCFNFSVACVWTKVEKTPTETPKLPHKKNVFQSLRTSQIPQLKMVVDECSGMVK